MISHVLKGKFALSMAGLLSAVAAQATTTFYDLGTIPAPSSGVNQLAYSLAYNTVIARNAGSAITVVNTATQATSTHLANTRFTDIQLSPSGRYVYAADYGGENIGYGAPAQQSYVHRLDLATGSWDVETVYIAGQVQPTSDNTFILKSLDQWVSVGFYQWSGAAAATSQGSYSNLLEYEGDFRYVPIYGRLIFGNSGISSPELHAYKISNNAMIKQEGSGIYGSANGYGGTVVLSTDQSMLFYGRLEVSTLDVSHNVQTFPEWIYAATGSVAFGSSAYYDPRTGSKLGTLSAQSTIYGMDPHSTDFWVFDATANQLHHYSSTTTPQMVSATLSGLSVSCSGPLTSGQSGLCSATASYSDGSSQTAAPTWSSSNPAALAVDNQGNLTAQMVTAATPVTISGSLTAGGVTRAQQATVTVNPPHILNALTIACPSTVKWNQPSACSATAAYTDSTAQDVAPTWSTSNPAALLVGPDGSLTAQYSTTAATATITATLVSNGVTLSKSATVSVPAAPAQPASITLASATTSGVTATIVPAPTDVGTMESVWMGAFYQGALYMRNGNSWQLYSGGTYPVALPAITLGTNNTINVVDHLDISNLAGLQLYLGFGNTWNDMLSSPGKLALIYTVPVPPLSGIALESTSVAASTSTKIDPVPSAAALGSCESGNTAIASVSGNVVTGVAPGTVDIFCGSVSARLTVTSAPLTGIALESASLSVGQQTLIDAQPSSASLGVCSSSNANVASVQGNVVIANNAGSATITCSGKSATVTVKALSCKQTAAGTYSGSIVGSYSGNASMTLTQQSGALYAVGGWVAINGLGNVSLTGQSQLPYVNLAGYCSSGGGAFQCFSASGTLNNGEVSGTYSTADGGSGSFDLVKSCS